MIICFASSCPLSSACNHIVWFAGGPRNPQGINFEALRPLIKSEQASVSEPDASVLCTHASP